MNKLFGNSYQVRGHDNSHHHLGGGGSLNQKGLPFQSESLFGMALYDFDTLTADVGFHNTTLPSPSAAAAAAAAAASRQNPQGPPPVFHPVDEYKDLSLKEILDLSDDFLSNEEDQLLGHNHHLNNSNAINDFRMGNDHFNHMSSSQFLPSRSSFMGATDNMMHLNNNNMNHQEQLLAFNLEQQLMLRQQQQQQQQNHHQLQQQHQHQMKQQLPAQAAIVSSMDSYNPKKRGREYEDEGDDCSLNGKDRRFRPYQAGQWSEKFQELCEYKEKMGHCLVPHTYNENLSLARWVKRQRYQYKLMMENKSSTMTPDRVAALDEIGFVWDSQGAAWGDRLGELQQFRQTYLHCNVPSNFADNPRLATWIKCQRRQYKLFMDGKASNMTPQRIQHLENLGFEWELRTYKKQRNE